MKKKLIALLALFNSNLIISGGASNSALLKTSTDTANFNATINSLSDMMEDLTPEEKETNISMLITNITISAMSDDEKQSYFKKLSDKLTELGLPKTVAEIQEISQKNAQEGTQTDINLLMDRLSAEDLTQEQFAQILKDFNKPTLAVARLVADQNVIAKTKTLLDTIKDVGDKNSWSYNSISEKEQEFLQKEEVKSFLQKAKVDAKSSLDTQYKTLFEAKIAALGKTSLGDDITTTAVKSFLTDLKDSKLFTAEQKEAIYKYCTTLDSNKDSNSILADLEASLGDKLAGIKTKLDLFRSFSVESRQAEIGKSFSSSNPDKRALLEAWQSAEAELKEKQALLDQATKDYSYYDPENIAEAQKKITEILNILNEPSLTSKIRYTVIARLSELKNEWRGLGILDQLNVKDLEKKIILDFALEKSANASFSIDLDLYKDNSRAILDLVRNFADIQKDVLREITSNKAVDIKEILGDNYKLFNELSDRQKEVFIEIIKKAAASQTEAAASQTEAAASQARAEEASATAERKAAQEAKSAEANAAKAQEAKSAEAQATADREAAALTQEVQAEQQRQETEQASKQQQERERVAAAEAK